MDNLISETSDFVNLIVTSSANEGLTVERRFKKKISVQEFKNKLELLVGCQSNRMTLEVYNKNGDIICKPNKNDQTLDSYPIEDGMRVNVIGDNENLAEDCLVEKFTLSEEEYGRRSDTVKAFLKENKLGKYNEEETKKKEEEKKLELKNEELLVNSMKVNDRCEVVVANNPRRRATIMYIGKTEFKNGWWVGVKFDEPFGKNNGSVAGKKYFECLDKYGGFVKPSCVVVGDFPEECLELDEEL